MKKILKIITMTLITVNSTVLPAYASENTFSNLKDVQEYIYNDLKDRDATIQFTYTGSQNDFKDGIEKTINQAYSEDDYTERSWKNFGDKGTRSKGKINFTIYVSYLTTKEQENYVDTEIKNIVSQLIKPNMTDVEKVTAINDYIMSRYEYDYSLKSNNAYSALTTGKATCQGYSMTAYKMLTYANIPNRIIVGTLNGVSHSWNYVEINNKWVHLDITSNDATKYKYFLVDDSVLENNNFSWNKSDYPQNNN